MTSPQSLIDQAAEEYALSFVRYGGLRWPRLDVDKLEAFKAGVAWRDEQMELDSLKARVEICSLKQKLEAMEERDEQVKELVEAVKKVIPEFQWVTNRIKMNEVQHVRLGDAIALLHDALPIPDKGGDE